MAFKHVFHPTDLSPEDHGAFVHAVKLAHAVGGSLTLFHVEEEDERSDHFPHVRDLIQHWKTSPHGELNVKKVKHAEDSPVLAIAEYLERHGTDLIVLSSHQKHGLARFVEGEVAQPVARMTHELTLFVPVSYPGFVNSRSGEVVLRQILVPVDTTPPPARVVELLPKLLMQLGLKECVITFLHVGEHLAPVEAPGFSGWRTDFRVKQGPVVETILKTAHELQAGLIVMATEGRHGFLDALRGSTTEQVLRRAECPVLAVPVGE